MLQNTPFFLTQALSPLMQNSETGSIVNISSIYGIVGPDWSLYEDTLMTNEAAYTASKGGLIALTRWLASYLAPNIRVNSITPGGVARGQDSKFVRDIFKHYGKDKKVMIYIDIPLTIYIPS